MIEDFDDDEINYTSYQNWGNSTRIESLTGAKWIDKFSRNYDLIYANQKRAGTTAITVYGITALVNTIGACILWPLHLSENFADGDLYDFAWFFIFLMHLIIWGTLLILWPLAYIGNTTTVWFLKTFANVALAGPYGIYGALAIALALGMFLNTSFAGTTTDAILILSTYVTIAGASSFVQLFFIQDIKEWY